jgi:ferritin-like protein
MNLPTESVKEFQEVLKNEYGKDDATFEEASEILHALCVLASPVYGE